MSRQPVSPAVEKLNRAVSNFGGVQVSHFFREHYHLYPNNDEKRAFLGEGAYGKAYTVRSATNTSEPIKVCKVMSMAKISQREREIIHTCAELAVLTKISPNNSRLNQARGIYYDQEYLYIVLDMTEAKVPDLATRLYSLMATYRPQSIPEVEILMERIQAGWAKKIPEYTAHYKETRKEDDESCEQLESYLAGKRAIYCDKQLLIVMGKLGVKAEAGNRMDLYDCVHTSAKKCLAEAKAAVIIKQCLQGVEFLHQSSVVHRDIKTENVIIGISKVASPKRDAAGKVVGVTFHEKIDAQLIDFGLAKHLKCQNVVQTPSLNMFGVPAEPIVADAGPQDLGTFGLGGDTASAPAGAGAWGAGARMPETATSTVATNFQLTCTPCGTEVFTALEGLLGFAGKGPQGAKGTWISTAQALPKLDIFGCGAMMYCMTHGCNPFRAPQNAKGLDKINALIEIIGKGPNIKSNLSEPSKRMIERMLHNDAAKRPTATDLLQDLYFKDVTDTYVYSVDLQGNETTEVATAPKVVLPVAAPAQTPAAVGVDAEQAIEEMAAKMEATVKHTEESKMDPKGGDAVNEALRGKEDDGDSEGKVRDGQKA